MFITCKITFHYIPKVVTLAALLTAAKAIAVAPGQIVLNQCKSLKCHPPYL